MRKAIVVLLVLALLVMAIQKARQRRLRCGCVEGCTCRDQTMCRCREEVSETVAAT